MLSPSTNVCTAACVAAWLQVKTLAGEFALAADDIPTAQLLASGLVAAGHVPAWSLAAGVGSAKRLQDDVLRKRLVAFALLHCPSERMALLLDELQAADRRLMNAGTGAPAHPARSSHIAPSQGSSLSHTPLMSGP